MELMNADEYIPEPERDTENHCFFQSKTYSQSLDVAVASGRIDCGTVRVNDEIEISSIKEETQKQLMLLVLKCSGVP